ncbi:SIS domain-containing protein [Granulosicoccus antarcticus]|uniref:Glutamine--fructose-6-phosphate aminotransferase (Isomerizing) n=1 Tax=Granulosicoccus antarcticus IMCC3135 TaxID=1192854 RepID=A0A2Z2NUM0_9GAMM|nr:SIS domain-containing protein [Granulosicoccus antarcticus]ASJ73721.1 Glutamine--fructose-6-phosphate aminotransferase (isomerizing) [Granulosicoccus antarcticus IMCC3135]
MSPTLTSITGQFDYWRDANMPAPLPPAEGVRIIIGCGTSYNLALAVAAAMNACGLHALAVPAGEWTIRSHAYLAKGVKIDCVIALSRSGETTETVQATAASNARGQKTIGITCAQDSALSTVAQTAIEFATHSSEGIVMTCSASLMLLAGYALAGLSIDDALATQAQAALQALDAIPPSAYSERTHFVFLGGGAHYGVSLEGALKLQEMAICYTQGFHPGEYRHGPVSLVDQRTAVIMLYHTDTCEEEALLVKELQAKGAWVLGLGGPGDASINVTSVGDLSGAEVLPALQLLGERYAQAHRIDTSTPRHLTKVVMLDSE